MKGPLVIQPQSSSSCSTTQQEARVLRGRRKQHALTPAASSLQDLPHLISPLVFEMTNKAVSIVAYSGQGIQCATSAP